jgi:GT2 family glycosyltransferase
MTPDISVIIPTFRRPHLLVEAIESVLRQKSVTTEIQVIDDCPFGSAEEAVAPYLDRGVAYRRSPSPSGGRPALVRNLGLPDARAEIIHFLDDDDLAPYGFYADALDVFARKPDIGVIFGKVAPFGEGGIDSERDYFDRAHRRARRCRLLGRKLGFSAALFFHEALLVCGAAMIRKRCAVAIGGFSAGLAVSEDVDFYARAIPNSARSASIGPRCITASALQSAIAPISAPCWRLPIAKSSRAADRRMAPSTSMR